MQISLFLWVFLGHSITVGFAKLIFTSLIRISAINPKSKHYVTLPTPRVVLVRRAKAFICRKVVPLARVTLPACRGETTRPPELSCPPRRVRDPNVNGHFSRNRPACSSWIALVKPLHVHLLNFLVIFVSDQVHNQDKYSNVF